MPAYRGLHRALEALALSSRGNRNYAVGRGANDRAYIVAFTRQAEAIIRVRAQLIRQMLRNPGAADISMSTPPTPPGRGHAQEH